eukprot:scaffold135659_cov37-Tisochrysis_lutea.AAC.2
MQRHKCVAVGAHVRRAVGPSGGQHYGCSVRRTAEQSARLSPSPQEDLQLGDAPGSQASRSERCHNSWPLTGNIDAVGTCRLLELLSELVVANAPDVGGAAWLAHHPLGHPDRVLGGATRDVLDRVGRDELGIHRLVLVLGEDRVIELGAPLVENILLDNR